MKVWMCKRSKGYSGGLAVVAANTKEEAIRTFFNDKDYRDLAVNIDGKIYPWEYFEENWYECTLLTANVCAPCVIDEDGYTE